MKTQVSVFMSVKTQVSVLKNFMSVKTQVSVFRSPQPEKNSFFCSIMLLFTVIMLLSTYNLYFPYIALVDI